MRARHRRVARFEGRRPVETARRILWFEAHGLARIRTGRVPAASVAGCEGRPSAAGGDACLMQGRSLSTLDNARVEASAAFAPDRKYSEFFPTQLRRTPRS